MRRWSATDSFWSPRRNDLGAYFAGLVELVRDSHDYAASAGLMLRMYAIQGRTDIRP